MELMWLLLWIAALKLPEQIQKKAYHYASSEFWTTLDAVVRFVIVAAVAHLVVFAIALVFPEFFDDLIGRICQHITGARS